VQQIKLTCSAPPQGSEIDDFKLIKTVRFSEGLTFKKGDIVTLENGNLNFYEPMGE
jgi:hypothetical protein